MQKSSTRAMRWAGAFVVAVAMGPVLGIAAAGASPNNNDPSGRDKNAVSCTDPGVDLPGYTQIDGKVPGIVNKDGFTLTVSPDDWQYASYTAPAGFDVYAVVKGGDAFAVYPPGETSDLSAPLNGGEQVPTISHWFICYKQQVTDSPTPDPTGTPTGTPTGSPTTPPVTTTTPPATTPPATTPPATTAPQLAAAPTVSFADACTTGVSVTLGNIAGALPVTFTVDSSTGKADKVTVAPGSQQTVSYPVVEDTTATVTVTADGLTTATHSYAKNCTQVQGLKVTKPTTAVLGESVTRAPAASGVSATTLPFTGTGFPVGGALALGTVLLALGTALLAAPERLLALARGRHRD